MGASAQPAWLPGWEQDGARLGDWSAARPMPCTRGPAEIAAAVTALHTRPTLDTRLQYFRSGSVLAANWVFELDDRRPVGAQAEPGPSFTQIVTEYAQAALVSAGIREVEGSTLCDAGRLVGRGIEAFLLWYAFGDVPTYGLLDRNAELPAVLAPMGDVGCGPEGMFGPGISTAVFPDLPGARVRVDGGGNLVTT